MPEDVQFIIYKSKIIACGSKVSLVGAQLQIQSLDHPFFISKGVHHGQQNNK